MKIFLTAINAKYIHSNLAVYSLKAYTGEYEKYVAIGEYTINNRVDDILEQIYKEKPDVLCFSCYIWNMDYVEELIREYKKLCPDVPVWVGGPEVSYEVDTFLKEHPQVTGVMIGEGERTFREFCEYYVDRKRELSSIRGIAYRDAQTGETVYTLPQEPLVMGTIPFCYDKVENFENRIIYYESSRGCPFRCSYCLSSIEKKLRFRDIELVKKELAFFIEKRVPQVKFVDRTFNCNKKHSRQIWSYITEHDNGVTNFHFEISADLLEEEDLLKTFQLVNNYLDPDGIFIFDFNTIYKYKEVMGDTVIAENREDCSFIWENYYDVEEEINEYDLTIFVQTQEDFFQRFTETHLQRGYTLAQMQEILQKAGLVFLKAIDVDTQGEVTEQTERICIIAREHGKRKEA